MDDLNDAVSEMLRRFGVSAVVDEHGGMIAAATPAPSVLPPLVGYGDVVSRGDLIRAYYVDGLRSRTRPPTEILDRVQIRRRGRLDGRRPRERAGSR